MVSPDPENCSCISRSETVLFKEKSQFNNSMFNSCQEFIHTLHTACYISASSEVFIFKKILSIFTFYIKLFISGGIFAWLVHDSWLKYVVALCSFLLSFEYTVK